MTMVNNVIEVLNYVIAARPLPLNSVIADTRFLKEAEYVAQSITLRRRQSASSGRSRAGDGRQRLEAGEAPRWRRACSAVGAP